MGHNSASPQRHDLLIGTALLVSAAALLHWPHECIAAVHEGLILCGNVLIPSLFPFFVLSNLVVSLGMASYLGICLEPLMRPVFHVNGRCSCALVLGLIGGYPVGARTAVTLYQNGQCSQTECERLLAFCNNSGPAFIFGVAGAGIFGNRTIGLILFLTHIAASLLVGLLFRFYHHTQSLPSFKQTRHTPSPPFTTAFTRSITDSLTSILNICAFVLFFMVFLRCLSLSGLLFTLSELMARLCTPLGLTPQWFELLLIGMIELSSGITSLSVPGSLSLRVSLAAFMLGWAGLSVHCQVLSFLGECNLSAKTYLIGKLLHGTSAALMTQLIFRCFPVTQGDDPCMIQLLDVSSSLTFIHSLFSSIGCLCLFFLLIVCGMKKRGGKDERCAL